MSETTISTPHRRLAAHVARPSGDGPWPGVVVLHDIFGISQVARDHAAWLASEGFMAVVPDLFTGGGRIRCIRAIFRDVAARSGPSFDEVNAVRDWLRDQDGCNGKIGVIGFCMGGGFALTLAGDEGFDAAAVNYGQVPADIEAVLAGACPIVGSFGARDSSLKGAAARLEKAATAVGLAHDIKEYPRAGHSFMDPHQMLLPRLLKVLIGGYEAGAAADAKARIIAFFRAHLA
ncbi:MAG: dienelactone hydrolase family protein [Limimaricola sp.]|uniref:dienelactone hydrolase family protein n=1 Tax=Limimaricola sp. TaxID=2211665 RepID=UPI001E09AB1E|nr:dienelactone hydrolase family protein [Limimaricola sp.]MBI1416355.1 dienelactone hydrolase family protein [Limimaricola sp.]